MPSGAAATRSPLIPELHSARISSCSSENACFPESTKQPIAVRMVEQRRHVGFVRVTCRPHGHHRRLACIASLKITGNRLLFTSSGSHSRWFPRRSGRASALRRTLHTARCPEIVRRCSRALALLPSRATCRLRGVSIPLVDGYCLSLPSCPLVLGCYFRASAPCLARQAIAPAEASLSLLLRGLCSLARVSSLVLLVSQHILFCL